MTTKIKNNQSKKANIPLDNTYASLVDAFSRNKLNYKALSRFTFPGDRLTNDTLGLNSIGYWDANEPQDWGIDWHKHKAIEFYFLESGKMPFAQNNEKVILKPNNLTITPPWTKHKIDAPIGIGKIYWVSIDLKLKDPHQKWTWPEWVILTNKDLNRLTKALKSNRNWLLKVDKNIKDCFLKISCIIDTDVNGSNSSKIRLFVNELLILLLNRFDNDESVINEEISANQILVGEFLTVLKQQLTENWTIEKMANVTGLGKTSFTYHCKQLTNLTPMHYLSLKRLELSKKILIDQPYLSIAEVAYSCGFTTSQYFSTIFKKYEKCTPLEYRHNNLVLQD